MSDEQSPVGLRIGPAGWSYEDWRGRVYPERPPKGFDELVWIARFFDTVEVNASFYRVPPAATAASWALRLDGHPRFRFAVKLHRSFTHEDRRIDPGVVARVREFTRPLERADRLGPLLLQFPWSFRPTASSIEHLARAAEAFEDHDVALELRHGGWARDEHRRRLEPLGLHPVSVDQPQVGDSLPPILFGDPELLYVRLHGRNEADWFRRDAGRDARYDYRYSLAELRDWGRRIEAAMAESRQAYVITNNHFRGQAVVNGLEIAALLGLDPPAYPAKLGEEFESLARTLVEAGASAPEPVEPAAAGEPRPPKPAEGSRAEADPDAATGGATQGDLFGPTAGNDE